MFHIERKLFFRSKKILISLLILAVCILISSVITGYQNQQAKWKVIQHYEQTIQNFDNTLQDLEKQYQNQQLSKEDYEAEKDFFTDYIANYQKEIEAVKREDWNYFYKKNIQHYLQDGLYISFAYESYEFPPQTIENTVLTSKYLLEHNLPTAFPTELFLTAFESPKTQTDKDMVQNLGQQALKGTSHEIWQWQESLGILLTVPLFLFCFADFFIKDQLGHNKQVRLLQTIGLSKKRIVGNKFFAFFVLYTVFFLTTYLLLFLIPSLINGTGSWNYPITTYSSKGLSFSFINLDIKPIYQVIGIAASIHYLYLLVILGLAQSLATIFKNGLAGIIATFGLAISASLYPNMFNPLSLWKAGNLADGSALLYDNLSGYSIWKLGMVLLFSILAIYLVQFYLLTRKREV